MPYTCDAECGEPALILVTNLELGQVLSWCPVHAGPCLTALGEMLTEGAAGPADELPGGPVEPSEAPNGAEATNGAARPKSRSRRRPAADKATAGTEAAPAPAAESS